MHERSCIMRRSLVLFYLLLFVVNLSRSCEVGPDALTNALESLGLSSEVTAAQSCVDTDIGQRCYFTIVPPCATASQTNEDSLGVPLLVGIHGKNSCPLDFLVASKWATKAVEECFVMVTPVGVTNKNVTGDLCFGFPVG
mmetsp:Transcript_23666/g.35030  ORF Transcript_23666/g.35030 Transcript_23666/m.35030 type:complete len:140 (-) Transcript_23666:2171-2590(-)